MQMVDSFIYRFQHRPARRKLVKCIIRCKWNPEFGAAIFKETKRVFPRQWVVLVTSWRCTGIKECTADLEKEIDGAVEGGLWMENEDRETDNFPLSRAVS